MKNEKISRKLNEGLLKFVSMSIMHIAKSRPEIFLKAIEPFTNQFPAGFYCTNAETGKIVYANTYFLNVVGYHDVDELNKAINGIYQDPDARINWLNKIKKEHTIQQHRATLVKNNKSPIIVEDSAFIMGSGKNKCVFGFIQEVTNRAREEQSLEKKVYIDSLTELRSRRYLEERLSEDIRSWRSRGLPVSTLMLDIDFFREWNDTHGHQGGDNMLRILGLQIRSLLKVDDIAIRYGGDEILIVLPVNIEDAIQIAERLRTGIETFGKIKGKATLKSGTTFTVSIGVASGKDNLEELIKRADMGLYEAKRLGRNIVIAFLPGV